VVRRHIGGNVGCDDGGAAAVLDAEGKDVHPFAAHADAAVAEDAAGPVIVDDRRPHLLFAVILWLGVKAVCRSILKRHVLQLALAAGIADGTVEGVIAEKKLQSCLAGLGDLRGLSVDDHAFGDRGAAGGLEFRHLVDPNDAHAAGCLERDPGIVAEGGNLDAGGLTGFDEEGACGSGELFAVYSELYVCHLRSLYLDFSIKIC
jgi:hypothetical protein